MNGRLFAAQQPAPSPTAKPIVLRVGQCLAICLLASLLVGCGTMEVTKFKTRNADSYANTAEKNGVTIGVQPITDKREVKETFKINLLEKGLLPILLVAENHSASSSFILAKDKVFVLNEATGTTSLSQQSKVTSQTAGDATAIAGASLLAATSLAGAPLMIAGLKMASDATVIQHNLADKELYSRTLGPGEKAQGFIYFHYPKGDPLSDAYHVLVEVKESSTGESTAFDFKVNLRPTKP